MQHRQKLVITLFVVGVPGMALGYGFRAEEFGAYVVALGALVTLAAIWKLFGLFAPSHRPVQY